MMVVVVVVVVMMTMMIYLNSLLFYNSPSMKLLSFLGFVACM
jgi:hypothetical protein